MTGVERSLTLFEKIWRSHVVYERDDGEALIYIDRHYLGDDLPRSTFETIRRKGISVRNPGATYAMADHFAPTRGTGNTDIVDDERRELVSNLMTFSHRNGISAFELDSPRHGIVHVVGPELGLSLPGMTIVCGDSHTSTHGAFGAYAFGIGASEVSHVLSTQTLWQHRPKTMLVEFKGTLPFGITAKDVVLALIAHLGVRGAVGHVIEYSGSLIRQLTIEGRMTLCNMSIEAGARAGLIAPDESIFTYLSGRPYALQGEDWHSRVSRWKALKSDPAAEFDATRLLDVQDLEPMVSWGTTPEESSPITAMIPNPNDIEDEDRRIHGHQALEYMGIRPGTPVRGLPVNRVFIGSCTNGRIEDLRVAAEIVRGRKASVPAMVVPGSRSVKLQAESEGLHRIFIEAGMEWLEPGCSMCLAINGDIAKPGERCASTSNRNFIGRQGPGVRTHLMNPGMAAAAAIAGRIVDYREWL